MLTAVDFDHHFSIEGEKVRYIAAERDLPSELGTNESPVAEHAPKLALRVRHTTSQRSCSCYRW
jgi:hypothetical protein